MKRAWTKALGSLVVSLGALAGCQHCSNDTCSPLFGNPVDRASLKGCDEGCLHLGSHGKCPWGMTSVNGEYIVPTEGGHPVYMQPCNGSTIR